jgi:hypothetical protein
MDKKKEINETVNRFNEILGYSPEKGGELNERRKRVVYQDYAEDDEEVEFGDEGAEASEEGGDEGNSDFDFGDEGSPEGEEGGEDFDFGGDFEGGDFGGEGGEEEVDEFGTADEFSAADDIDTGEDVEEIDVTAIVGKSDEAKEAAELAVSAAQQNSEYLKSMTDTIENLSGQLTKMDTILNRVTKLEKDIKTPEEKLELRSLDSYPFNVKLSDYWEDKAEEDDNYNITGGETTVNGKTKEYTISKDDIDTYNEEEISTSFNPEMDGEDVTIYKRKTQY